MLNMFVELSFFKYNKIEPSIVKNGIIINIDSGLFSEGICDLESTYADILIDGEIYLFKLNSSQRSKKAHYINKTKEEIENKGVYCTDMNFKKLRESFPRIHRVLIKEIN